MIVEISKKFKQKDLIIKKIGIDYRKVRFLELEALVIKEDESGYIENKKDNSYYNELKIKVDYILLQLDEQLARIIFNEYLTNKVDNWWIYYYSKSTYYRLKNKAMDCFLEWWYA
jgi:hypothetical protein